MPIDSHLLTNNTMWFTLNISRSQSLTYTHAHTYTHTHAHTHTHASSLILSFYLSPILSLLSHVHSVLIILKSKISFMTHTRTLNVATSFNQCLSHTLVFILYLLIRIREVLAQGLGSGDWVGWRFASINIFCFNVEEPAVATRIQERRVHTRVWQVGQCCTTNISCVSSFSFSFFKNVSVTIPSRYYQFDIVHIYDNDKIRASI